MGPLPGERNPAQPSLQRTAIRKIVALARATSSVTRLIRDTTHVARLAGQQADDRAAAAYSDRIATRRRCQNWWLIATMGSVVSRRPASWATGMSITGQ